MSEQQRYLGDAVYASWDGRQIRLWTVYGRDQEIFLAPAVFQALVSYQAEITGGSHAKDQ